MIQDLLNMLYWRNAWLLAFIALPLLLVLFNQIKQQRQWKRFADEALQPWLKANNKQSRQTQSIFFLVLAWLCFVIALAGPRLVDWLPAEQQAEPASLIIVVDLSASMNADDAYPSRKDQAIQWLSQSIKSKPDHLKIGLILFSGHAFNLMSPTLDKEVIKHFIAQLNKLSLPTLGNDLTAALTLAKQQFNQNDREQIITILSDGDFSKQEQDRAQLFIKNKLQQQSIIFIGFGGNKAVKLAKQSGGFVLFNGRPVQSRLQTTWLRQLEQLDHVSYQHYDDIKKQAFNKTIHLSAARLNPQAQQYVIWYELFPYSLTLAMLFLLFSFWRINLHNNKSKLSIQIILSGFIMVLFSSHSPTSQASDRTTLQKANSTLKIQNYKQAQTLFSQIDSAVASFGEGIACYRQDDFKCATRAFSKAAWQANNNKVRANAVFNLANSYFFLGEYAQASVLFKDAENLGFNAKIAQKNLEFSNVMQRAVLQRIKDIKETFRRAKWRAAVSGNPSPSLNSFVSNQNNLNIARKENQQSFLIRQAIAQQVNLKFGFQQSNTHAATHWIKTEHIAKQSTAQLLKRLFEMELAIPAPLKEPQAIKGKRRW